MVKRKMGVNCNKEGQTVEVCKESMQDSLKDYQVWRINVTGEDEDGMAVWQASGVSGVRAKHGGLWQSMWSNMSRQRGSRCTKWAHIRKGLILLAAQQWQSLCGSKRSGWRQPQETAHMCVYMGRLNEW